MRTLTEEQISELEQRGCVIDRDDDGNVVSVTHIIDPGPLVVSDAEYLQHLLDAQEIARAMHAPDEATEDE